MILEGFGHWPRRVGNALSQHVLALFDIHSHLGLVLEMNFPVGLRYGSVGNRSTKFDGELQAVIR